MQIFEYIYFFYIEVPRQITECHYRGNHGPPICFAHFPRNFQAPCRTIARPQSNIPSAEKLPEMHGNVRTAEVFYRNEPPLVAFLTSERTNRLSLNRNASTARIFR